MNLQKFSKYLAVFVISLLVLVGCGGSSGGDFKGGKNNPTGSTAVEKTIIKGVVTDDPVIGATVKVLSLNNNTIQTATTDSNGSFSIEVDKNKIANGFILEATGGKMNGTDFNNTLSAIYGSKDNITQANVTLITTLVAKMAQDSISRSGTLIDKRDEALQKLADMGMLKKIDWFQTKPSLVNMEELRAIIYEIGISNWINSITVDLSDNQLGRDKMSIFGMAHGGVLSIHAGSNKLSMFPTDNKQIKITFDTESNKTNFLLKPKVMPTWVTIDGTKLILSPRGVKPGKYNISIQISNNLVKIGREYKLEIEILKPKILLQGNLTPSGGKIENVWKDISISVEPGVLDQEYNIKLVGAVNSNNELFKRYIFYPEISTELRRKLKVIVAPSNLIIKNYFNEQNSTIREVEHGGLNPCIYESWGSYKGSGFKYNILWDFSTDDFINSNDYDINGYPRLLVNVFNDTKTQCAWTLRTTVYKQTFEQGNPRYNEEIVGKTPVLFVHGFIRSGDLGGYDVGDKEKYFGEFPRLAQDLGFIPFEFDWRTNANFRQVASDLGRAITLITEKTGKKVHIVAHSYGGVLIRTLLENMSLQSNIYTKEWAEKHIASVTTVGTPHQGIFASQKTLTYGNKSITFPEGQHGYGEAIKACRAITCYQVGVGWDYIKDNASSFLIDSEVGEFLYNLTNKLSDYPNIPTQILMGILTSKFSAKENTDGKYNIIINPIETTGTGDNLIHIASQRIAPDLGISGTVIQNGQSDFNIPSNIEEHFLGFRADNYNNFIVGYQDNIPSLLQNGSKLISNEIINGSQLIGKFNRNWVPGYGHMTSLYKASKSYNVSKSGFDKTFYASPMSEVGIQNCKNVSKDQIDYCSHATWNYFRKFVENHPSEEIDPPEKIQVSGTVRLENGEIPDFPVTVEIHAGNYSRSYNTEFTTINSSGKYEANITYYPDTNYTVFAYPENSNIRASSSLKLKTYMTLEESTLHFPTITLVGKNYQEGSLKIKVTDGTTGSIINDFNATILNTIGINVDENNTNIIDSGYTTTQPVGDYIVKISKEGYNSGEAQCTIDTNETTECIVNIVSNATIANGQITAVLSWGATPSDLDSHLVRKTNGNVDYHVYYGNKNGTDANLDRDDTSSFGPETITINNVSQDSVYTYYVYNYSGGAGSILPNSGAKVELNFNGTQRTFIVPNEEGQYWKVFEIDHGRIIPCTSHCVFNSSDGIVRNINSDSYLFKNLPSK